MARELKGEKLEKELLRLEEMKAYEKENARYGLICGIDEDVYKRQLVGRLVDVYLEESMGFYYMGRLN